MPRKSLLQLPFSIHRDPHDASPVPVVADAASSPLAAADAAPGFDASLSLAKTLTPRAVNSMHGRHALARSATIRSVPSFEGSESSPDSRRSPFASSVNSTASASSTMAASIHDRSSPAVRLKDDLAHDAPARWAAKSVRSPEPNGAATSSGLGLHSTSNNIHDSSLLSDATDHDPGHWDSTIGKAGLGKTGRVINKLVSDNDALKRDIQIERLRADEAKQAARLIEDKIGRIIGDYESRLLEASVTKTLLIRKERQVETLTATVEAEKKKAGVAVEREKSWRLELDKVKSESAAQIEEATAYAQLMEGRYNAISHWRDQGDEVRRALARIKGDISSIVSDRKADDDKIQTLRDLCEQQDSNIKQLRREKDSIGRLFDQYKQTQEDDLRAIKSSARQREDEQERLLDASRQALAKLRWALNVKQNVKDAQ